MNRTFAAKAAVEDNGCHLPTLETAIEAVLHNVKFKSREVRRLLKNLQVTKATDSDDIGARVLRECATELAPSLSRLFRISLRSGRVPMGGAKENPENYRPISLLPIVSKTLETIINR